MSTLLAAVFGLTKTAPATPALGKLPDYVAAWAIEETIR